MRKRGIVVKTFEKGKIFYAELNIIFSEKLTSCTAEPEKKLSGCAGCAYSCSGKRQNGFGSGKIITALNKTGKQLTKGSLVEFEVSFFGIVFQTFFNIIFPFLLGGIAYFIGSLFLFSEIICIFLFFLSIIAGVLLALILKKVYIKLFFPVIISAP